jgi:hypothetical protein
VLYWDGSGNIQDLWFDDGWHVRRLNNGGCTGAPPAAGDPAAASAGTALHVAYRDGEGGIREVWFDGAWHSQLLNGGPGAGATEGPLAQGDPAVRVVDGATRHVTYRDLAGGIQDLWNDGSWHVQQLNRGGCTQAPPAASDPVCLVPPSNWEYVSYVDIFGQAQLLSHFLDNPWQATRLMVPGGR